MLLDLLVSSRKFPGIIDGVFKQLLTIASLEMTTTPNVCDISVDVSLGGEQSELLHR